MSEKPERKESCHQIMIKVVNEICDNYCKYSEMMVPKDPDPDSDMDMLEETLYLEYCSNCPLNRLC